LSERLLALHLQDRTPRRAIVESVPLPQPYRASGLVLWPDSDIEVCTGSYDRQWLLVLVSDCRRIIFPCTIISGYARTKAISPGGPKSSHSQPRDSGFITAQWHIMQWHIIVTGTLGLTATRRCMIMSVRYTGYIADVAEIHVNKHSSLPFDDR
jgi:hypothetical protein